MGDISEVSILSAHAVNHKQGGNDSIRLDELATPLDNTVLNSTNARHGLLPKLSNNANQYLNGVGAFAAIPAGSVPAHASTHKTGGSDQIKLDELLSPDDNLLLNATTAKHGLLPKLGGGTANFLRADGAWDTPSGLGVDIPPYVYDSYPVSYNITVDGAVSGDGKWRNLYRGSRPDQPADTGLAGVRVPASPTNGFARVFFEYPYLATYTGLTSPPTSSTMCLTNTGNFTDIDFTIYMRLVDQRRQVPFAWEGPWIFFRFNTVDGTNFHHYYLVLKTDGHIEFGRKDNTTHTEEQTFLDTSPTYTYALNTWTKVRIKAEGNLFNIWINDVPKIVDLLDDGTVGSHYDGSGPIALLPPSLAMYQGLIGIYNEDAEVEFGPLTITELSTASSANAVTTYSNSGTGSGSVAITQSKEGSDLPFKGISPGSAYITVFDDTAFGDIKLGVANLLTTNAVDKITVNDPQPLTFYRTSNTVGNTVGTYHNLRNASSTEVTYGIDYVEIEVNTAGAHRGDYFVQLAVAAVMAVRFRVYTSGNGGIIIGNNQRIQLDETGLTGARAYTFPDISTKLAGLADDNEFTAIQKINAASAQLLTLYRPVNTVGLTSGQYYNLQTSTNAEATYGLEYVAIEVNTNGANRGDYYLQLAVAGALAIRFRVYTSGNGGIIIGNNQRVQLDETNQTSAHAFTFPNVSCALIGNGVDGVTLADGKDFDLGTTTGTMFGTGPTQKLGFFGATPVVQGAANPDTSSGVVATVETEVNQIKALLRAVGLMAP